jgi:hypothetical protein
MGRAEMENACRLPVQMCGVYWSNNIYHSSHGREIWFPRELLYVARVTAVVPPFRKTIPISNVEMLC